MQDTVWTTKDGKKILVSQMATSHILRCLALMRRKHPWRAKYKERLELELTIRAIRGS